jgi:hypothetical protein
MWCWLMNQILNSSSTRISAERTSDSFSSNGSAAARSIQSRALTSESSSVRRSSNSSSRGCTWARSSSGPSSPLRTLARSGAKVVAMRSYATANLCASTPYSAMASAML